MYDEKVEQAILERLHECESEKQTVERKLESARFALVEKEEAIAHWQFALADYRKAHDLPMLPYHNAVLSEEYAHMAPTELVYYWADKHNGEVIIKGLAKAAIAAGIFKNYRTASSSIYSVLKRKNLIKVGPGHFKKT